MHPEGHLTARQIDDFCAPTGTPGTLIPAERLVISDHLAQCAACRALVTAAAAAKPDDGRRRLLAEGCGLARDAARETAREQEDLAAFAKGLETFPEERFRPGGTLPASARSPKPGVWPNIGWRSRFSWPAFVTAGAAAMLVAAGLVAFIFLKPKSGPPSQIASADPLLKDGPVLVAADGSLHADAGFPDELRRALSEVIARRAISVPGSLTLAMRGGSVQPDAGPPATPAVPPLPVLPAVGSTVETRRPLLQWTGVPNATGYRVEITSAAVAETLLSPRLPLSTTNWQPETDLVRGRIYHWRVLPDASTAPTVGKNVDEMTSVSFKVLSEAGESELQGLRASPHPSHLALAITCARLNLLVEARQELNTLRVGNPHSTLAAQLRDSLESRQK